MWKATSRTCLTAPGTFRTAGAPLPRQAAAIPPEHRQAVGHQELQNPLRMGTQLV